MVDLIDCIYYELFIYHRQAMALKTCPSTANKTMQNLSNV